MSWLSLDNVSKSYGSYKAVDGVSYSISGGEILTLLGPNGAGKTTTVGMVLGLVKPSSGKISLFGGDPSNKSSRLNVGATPQDSNFPQNAKAIEVVELVACHYKNPLSTEDVIARFGVSKFKDKLISNLSGGQRRCVSLACAFVGNPKLILLDEPTTGLDVDVRRNLWEQILEFKSNGGSILLTTHYLEEADIVSDRVIVMNQGKIVKHGSPKEIRDGFKRSKISFRLPEPKKFPEAFDITESNGLYTLVSSDADEFVKEYLATTEFSDLSVLPMTLEEAFIEIIKERKGDNDSFS